MLTRLGPYRSWVRAHAQDYVLEYFRLLAERRKNAHTAHLDQISAHAFYHYNAPPHPNQIADAQAMLKRGIDEDWQASVQRYPEVLEYYFGLVELTLPADDEPAVKDPPLSALNGGSRKAIRRAGTEDESSSSSRAGGSGPFPAVRGPLPPAFGDRDLTVDRRNTARRDRRPRPARMSHPPAPFYAPYP